jgi:O-antigen/teichoic acid export membrane protein
LVGLWFGSSELAVFAFGEMVYGYLRSIGTHTHSLYFPRLAGLHPARTKGYLVLHTIYWTVGTLGLAIIGCAILPTVYRWLFGTSFVESATYAGWYALAFALGVPNFFITIYLRHMRATRETYLYGVVRTPLQLGFLALGFWIFGILGLPLARGLTVLMHALIGWWLVCGYEKRQAIETRAVAPGVASVLRSRSGSATS